MIKSKQPPPHPNNPLQTWTEAATQELNGANPFEKLSIRKEDLIIQPYYKKTDKNQVDFILPASDSKIYGARAWQNIAEVLVTDEKTANTKALHYLSTGADGILFVVNQIGLNLPALLAGIAVEDCAVSLLLDAGCESEAGRYLDFAKNKNLTGCIFYRQSTQVIYHKSLSANFVTCGIYINPDKNPVNELVQALGAGVALMDKLTNQGLSAQAIAAQVGFCVSIDSDFFVSIAKLKALRILWNTVLTAYGVSGAVQIHAISTSWTKDSFQPHGNLIKSTTAALAAIVGGCNYLTVQPESENEPGNRAARLVSAVLREESHLSKVADPTAGSYYLASLIEQLVDKSWQQFLTNLYA
ncbi:MAG: hypothetical protein BroJett042_18480 [Bacteroidota bacterium]|nr:MAG: hypothetical protein BroJett042_18480 [Bacteroidota bacterium]